eukprot:TRINITY_DN484_c1_g1_i2.p1 TRINITY_DN484_c1_g1~~TRINITY_DN484_c1_g1_i2.p1  ORF type:complete len:103 (+),score=5.11 TRINITY_DN484_c1_g1_i2:293-601(+)
MHGGPCISFFFFPPFRSFRSFFATVMFVVLSYLCFSLFLPLSSSSSPCNFPPFFYFFFLSTSMISCKLKKKEEEEEEVREKNKAERNEKRNMGGESQNKNMR